jgi:hypothetical protein
MEILCAAVKKVKDIGYGKDEATYGYHHFVEFEQLDQDMVHCTLFLHTGSIHKSHEFVVKVEDVIGFAKNSSVVFEKDLENSDAMLGDVKMKDNWPVDVDNLRVGLLKAVLNIVKFDTTTKELTAELTQLIFYYENKGNSGLEGHGFTRCDDF